MCVHFTYHILCCAQLRLHNDDTRGADPEPTQPTPPLLHRTPPLLHATVTAWHSAAVAQHHTALQVCRLYHVALYCCCVALHCATARRHRAAQRRCLLHVAVLIRTSPFPTPNTSTWGGRQGLASFKAKTHYSTSFLRFESRHMSLSKTCVSTAKAVCCSAAVPRQPVPNRRSGHVA